LDKTLPSVQLSYPAGNVAAVRSSSVRGCIFVEEEEDQSQGWDACTATDGKNGCGFFFHKIATSRGA